MSEIKYYTCSMGLLYRRKSEYGIDRYDWLPFDMNGWKPIYGTSNKRNSIIEVSLDALPKKMLTRYTNPVLKEFLKEAFYYEVLQK